MAADGCSSPLSSLAGLRDILSSPKSTQGTASGTVPPASTHKRLCYCPAHSPPKLNLRCSAGLGHLCRTASWLLAPACTAPRAAHSIPLGLHPLLWSSLPLHQGWLNSASRGPSVCSSLQAPLPLSLFSTILGGSLTIPGNGGLFLRPDQSLQNQTVITRTTTDIH